MEKEAEEGMSTLYVRVTKRDSSFFEFLDPYEKLRLLSLPFGFAMGALEEDGDELIPVGLLVASVSDEALFTEWLSVSLDHRWRGIGEGLLYRAFETAADLGLGTVRAVFMPEYDKEEIFKHAKTYFEKRLFTKKYRAGADVELELYGIKTTEKTAECKSFSDMSLAERSKCVDRLSAIDNATYTYSPRILLPGLDNDISVVCKKENAIEGALLCCVTDDTIYPLYHYAGSMDISDSLIASAVAAAKKKYGRGMRVSVMLRQSGEDEYISRALRSVNTGTMLEASVKELIH